MAEGVIFDMDGVLVASGKAHAESWRVLARQSGREVSPEFFQEVFGMRSQDIIKKIWGDDLSDEDIRTRDEEKERVYRDLIRGIVPLTVGVRECLTQLKEAGLKLAVGTSGPPENLNLVLEEGRLSHFFDATVHGFDVSNGKPAPDVFLLAAERAGIGAGEGVVVEDAPVGIEAARAAEMPAIGFVGTHPADRLRAAGATRAVDSFSEITPTVIRELLER